MANDSSNQLLAQLFLDDLNVILREKRICCFGHVKRLSGAIKTARDMKIQERGRPERPKMIWKALTERDRREWKLSKVDPSDKDMLRSRVRSAMHAASLSYLEGGQLMLMMLLHLHNNQNTDDDDDDDDFNFVTFVKYTITH